MEVWDWKFKLCETCAGWIHSQIWICKQGFTDMTIYLKYVSYYKFDVFMPSKEALEFPLGAAVFT